MNAHGEEAASAVARAQHQGHHDQQQGGAHQGVHPISLGDPEAGDQEHGEQQDPDSQTHPGIHLQGQQDMGYGGLPPVADQVSAALLKLGMTSRCSHLYTPSIAWGKGERSQPMATLPSRKPSASLASQSSDPDSTARCLTYVKKPSKMSRYDQAQMNK